MSGHFAEWVAGLGPGIANHLWQSTAVVAAAWLVTLGLRANQARVRYAVWLAASMKFLVPFSLLIAMGNLLPHPKQAVAPVVYSAMDVVEEPFAEMPQFVAPMVHVPTMRERVQAELPAGLFVLWVVGAAIVLFRWARGWRVVRRTLRDAEVACEGREWEILRRVEVKSRPISEARPAAKAAGHASIGSRALKGAPTPAIELRWSAERMEPGIFGVGRPVLVWPRELSARLDDEHIEAIMAHELAHVRRRDNLTAALHMLVETVFWFHPMVWWMERQMVKEREQACDEAVVAMGGDEEIYAESLLKTCRFCIESPLVCVAGVTGADLRQRVVAIVTGRALLQMSWAKKALIAVVAACVVAAPVVLGQAKAAQRLMLAAIEAAPKPVQAVAKAMLAEASSSDAADAEQTAASADNTTPPPTVDEMSLGPEFEVATIRPAGPNEKDGGGRVTPSGRFEGRNMTVQSLVGYAYTRWQSYGGEQVATEAPEWAHTQRFDVEAKLSDQEMMGWGRLSNFQRTEYVRPMLRRLLADRFHVQVRTEQRATRVYALVVAKSGSKLKEVAQPSGSQELSETEVQQRMQDVAAHKAAPFPESFTMTGDSWSGTSLPLGLLAMEIAANARLDAPLVDRTGLNGYYDFGMKVSYEKDAPPLIDQIEQQLGLRVEPRKVPLKYYVITSAERPSVDGAEVGADASAASAPAAQVQEKGASGQAAQNSAAVCPDTGGLFTAYDVVSVRPSNAIPRMVGLQEQPDGIHSETVTVAMMVQQAYSAERMLPADDAVVGLPDWGKGEYFAVNGKMNPEQVAAFAKLDKDQQKGCRIRMLKALLADRFNVRVHMQSRQVLGYELVVASGGSKMKEVTASDPDVFVGSNGKPMLKNLMRITPRRMEGKR